MLMSPWVEIGNTFPTIILDSQRKGSPMRLALVRSSSGAWRTHVECIVGERGTGGALPEVGELILGWIIKGRCGA